MDNQSKFIEMIEDVTTLAKINGRVVTTEFLKDYFKELDLQESQFQMVYDYLLEHNIRVLGYDKAPKKNASKDNVSEEYKVNDEPESEYLDIYLKEVSSAKNKGERITVEILEKMYADDDSARETIVEMYLPKVISIAEEYKSQGVSQSDLIQEGNIGLLIALSSLKGMYEYDMKICDVEEVEKLLEKNIRDSILDAIDELSEHKKSDRKIINKADMVKEKAEELAETMNDKFTMEEMAQYMDMNLEEIEDILRITGEEL